MAAKVEDCVYHQNVLSPDEFPFKVNIGNVRINQYKNKLFIELFNKCHNKFSHQEDVLGSIDLLKTKIVQKIAFH